MSRLWSLRGVRSRSSGPGLSLAVGRVLVARKGGMRGSIINKGGGMRFSGEVEVEDGEFEMAFKELIVRSGEVGFQLQGHDVDWGVFHVSGTAAKLPMGEGFSAEAVAEYEDCPPGDARTEFSLLLEKVEVLDDGQTCRVVGAWIERPDRWPFSGTLDRV